MERGAAIINLLAQLVRDHRKAAGLTQVNLAKLADVGKTAIFDLEHAKETIQLDTVLKILMSLNIKIEFSSSYMDHQKKRME